MSDLWLVDSELARSLQNILEIGEGDSISEILGVYFLVSKNPLIDSCPIHFEGISLEGPIHDDAFRETHLQEESNEKISYIELIEGGSDILVDRSNRVQFVDLFMKHALYLSVKDAADNFVAGLKLILCSPLYDMCTHIELETIICGSPDVGDLSLLRMRTIYKGDFNDEHVIIQWFWVNLIF